MLKVNYSVPVAEFVHVKVYWDRHKGKNTFSCQASAIYKLTLWRFRKPVSSSLTRTALNLNSSERGFGKQPATSSIFRNT